jgi:hypothetical protein
MKHYPTEQWIDFVNGAMPPSGRAEMQKHLEQGCKRCSEAVSRWQRIRRAASTEAGYQPPSEDVRMAKAMFAGSKWVRKKGLGARIEILFDSFLTPVLEGVRSAGSVRARRMLYRVDPFRVDLQIEAPLGRNSVVVTGQLLDLRSPESVCSEVSVLVSNMRGQVVQATTNQFGEFREEIETSGNLELVFRDAKNKLGTISLSDVLGQSLGRKR